MITEADLRRLQRQSQRGFFAAMASGSPAARLLELAGGVQGTVVPVRPWFSIFNSVVYQDAEALDDVQPQLASAYEEAGVKAWTVWVPPEDRQAGPILERHGHNPDSTPMLMAAEIASIDVKPRRDLDLDPEPTWETVARCNDRAHGVLEDWSMAAVFSGMSDPGSRLYAARHHGELASALIAREHDGDCYFWFVATVPEAQRQGLSSDLMRHALREAAESGCTTTTLESTKVAEPMYEALGYIPLGRYEMWELRET